MFGTDIFPGYFGHRIEDVSMEQLLVDFKVLCLGLKRMLITSVMEE